MNTRILPFTVIKGGQPRARTEIEPERTMESKLEDLPQLPAAHVPDDCQPDR